MRVTVTPIYGVVLKQETLKDILSQRFRVDGQKWLTLIQESGYAEFEVPMGVKPSGLRIGVTYYPQALSPFFAVRRIAGPPLGKITLEPEMFLGAKIQVFFENNGSLMFQWAEAVMNVRSLFGAFQKEFYGFAPPNIVSVMESFSRPGTGFIRFLRQNLEHPSGFKRIDFPVAIDWILYTSIYAPRAFGKQVWTFEFSGELIIARRISLGQFPSILLDVFPAYPLPINSVYAASVWQHAKRMEAAIRKQHAFNL